MTGSLKKAIKPGSLVIPDDYLSFSVIPTFFKDRIIHITPALDESLRASIINAARKGRIKIVPTGVYVQTAGPRLETKAEIGILKNYGDIIGMTLASEATLAQEIGLGYAAICTVENYANGLSKAPLDFDNIAKEGVKHSINELSLLSKVVEDL
jgi:5'-methylthioadenosine phosphorylase